MGISVYLIKVAQETGVIDGINLMQWLNPPSLSGRWKEDEEGRKRPPFIPFRLPSLYFSLHIKVFPSIPSIPSYRQKCPFSSKKHMNSGCPHAPSVLLSYDSIFLQTGKRLKGWRKKKETGSIDVEKGIYRYSKREAGTLCQSLVFELTESSVWADKYRSLTAQTPVPVKWKEITQMKQL